MIKGCGGFKTNLNKKEGGVGSSQIIIFSITSVWIIFFFKCKGTAERGDAPGQLKKYSGRVGTWGEGVWF